MQHLSFGDRASDASTSFLGSWKFVNWMTAFILVWLLWNSLAPEGWQFDPKVSNFTLLTMILSLQASYSAPLILMSQNRQADRDRAQANEDHQKLDRILDLLTRDEKSVTDAVN